MCDNKIAEFVTDLEVKELKSVTIFDVESGEEVLHWDFDTGGSDDTSVNTD